MEFCARSNERPRCVPPPADRGPARAGTPARPVIRGAQSLLRRLPRPRRLDHAQARSLVGFFLHFVYLLVQPVAVHRRRLLVVVVEPDRHLEVTR